MMDSITAEEAWQQGLSLVCATQGDHRENLRRAIACYEIALQFYTREAAPERWNQLQQELAAVYSELVQERLAQTPEQESVVPARSRRLLLPQLLLLMLLTGVILAIPTGVIATTYLARNAFPCVNGTLNIDGSTALQPLVEEAAKNYMQNCPGAVITVGGGASKIGLADVEQGHDLISGIDPRADQGHLAGKDVAIDIGDSDIFSSPVQHDLVDHQVAIGVFVMILNREVTGLHNLSTSQIQGIYTGVYQKWQQICDRGVCGPDLPIVPISRTANSGTRFTFEKYILKGVATVPGIGLERATSSGNAVQEVENNAGSVGYAPLYLASQAHDVTLLSIDNHDPRQPALVQNDTYKFWNIEHMYTRGPGSPLAQSFLHFITGNAERYLITRLNFLHLSDIDPAILGRHVLEAQ